jgi:hypothetical protein
MKKVYESLDPIMVGHIKNLLENEGIACVTRNEFLASAAGIIPLCECWYEIWVTNEEQYEKAKNVIQSALSKTEPSEGPEWVCPSCGERLENQFTACWNCGKERA